MQTASTRQRPAPPSTSASETPRPASALERIEGRIESVTDTGLRLSGRWYEYPRGWAGQRPAVGQAVRLHYRTRFVMQTIEPIDESGNRATPPARSVSHPSSALSSSPSSSRAARANGTGRTETGRPRTETTGNRTVVRGTIEAANDRGIKLDGAWYNFSRVTPLADDVRAALVRGATVRLTVENNRWIAEAVVEAEEAEAPALMGGDEYPEGGYDESYL
jgi:hypothetical protein